jgi:hypothetical protein
MAVITLFYGDNPGGFFVFKNIN